MFEKSAVADPFEKIFAVISPTETGHWSKEKSTCASGEKGGASDFPSVFSFPIVTRLIPEV